MMDDSKTIWQSKTFWLSMLGILIGIVELASSSDLFGDRANGYIMLVLGSLHIVNRVFTEKSIKLS